MIMKSKAIYTCPSCGHISLYENCVTKHTYYVNDQLNIPTKVVTYMFGCEECGYSIPQYTEGEEE